MAYFPTSPSNGSTVTVNGIIYTYDSTKTAWKRVLTPISTIDVSGNINVGNVVGNVYTTSGVFWANGLAFFTPPAGVDTQLQFRDGTIFGNANIRFIKGNGNLVITSVTNSVDVNSGALVVRGGLGVAGNVTLGSSITGVGGSNVVVAANTISTSFSTGAFVVVGGAGIAGNLYANANVALGGGTTSNVVVRSVTTSLSSTTGALVVQGGVGIAGNLYANSNVIIGGGGFNSNLLVNSVTTSTSTTTGAMVVIGGAGVGGNIWSGGNIFTTNGLFWAGNRAAYNIAVSGSDTQIQYNDNGVQNGANITFAKANGNVVINSVTTSGNTTSGALVIRGGMGVAGNTYISGNVILGSGATSNVVIAATTASGNTTSGALVVAGGVGIAGNLWITNTNDVSANIGAFYTYANANIGTITTQIASLTSGANTNTAAYLTTYTGNISAANIVISANTRTKKLFIQEGLFWSGNNAAFTSGAVSLDELTDVAITGPLSGQVLKYNGTSWVNGTTAGGTSTILTYTASTTLPADPNIGDRWFDTNDGTVYEYVDDGTSFQWVDIVSPSLSASGSAIDDTIRANVGAYQIYANANIGTLFLGNVSTQANIGTLFLGNAATQANLGRLFLGNTTTQANLGAFQTFSNANAATQATSINTFNANLGAFQTFSNANAATQQTQINSLVTSANANVAAYLNTFNGNASIGNLNIPGTGFMGLNGISYLLERANIVAAAPAPTINFDVLTSSVLYWNSNVNTNATVNIRGNATVALNNVMAVGQTSTVVLFFPQQIAYYVSTVQVDSTTVTPSWLGNSAPIDGNANSIDIYSFTVLKKGAGSFKVFASYSTYQNTGL